MPQPIYCKAGSTGANDGTSWDDAYTSLATAVAAWESAGSGTTLYTDGDFYEKPPQVADTDDLTWIGNQGESERTRAFGLLQLTVGQVTDNGGNVFSFASSLVGGDPATVTWDYQQDSSLGAVTGVTVLDSESVAASLGAYVAPPKQVAAWFGHMRKVAATTTPASGQWSVSGGNVYVNPPDTPADVSDFVARVGVGRLGTGLDFQNCDRLTLRGITAIAWGDTNTQRGAFYFTGCRYLTLHGLTSYDAGYRSFNLEGSTGATSELGHRVSNCVACGDWARDGNSNFHFVIYNTPGSPDANCKLLDCHAVLHPWLDWTGRPIAGSTTGQTHATTQFKPSFAFFHTADPAGSPTMGGIELVRCGHWSQCQNLNAKHNATSALGMHWEEESFVRLTFTDVSTTDQSDPDDYGVVARNCLVLGNFQNHNILLDACRMIVPSAKGGLASYENADTPESATDYDWITLATAQHLYWRLCEVFAYGKEIANGGMIRPLSSASEIYMPGCTVSYALDTPGFDANCIFRPSANCIIHAPGSVFISSGTGSFGGNNRPFMRYNGSTPSGAYPAASYGNINFDGCWWFGFSSSFAFYRGSSSVATDYAHFSDTAGGSPIDDSDLVFGTDPELLDADAGRMKPENGGNLDLARLTTGIAELAGLRSIYGPAYADRYGAYQGAPQAPFTGRSFGDASTKLHTGIAPSGAGLG